jgi:hypothetical protein
MFLWFAEDGQTVTSAASTAEQTEGSLQRMRDQFVQDIDPDIEQKRAEAAALAWGNNSEKRSGAVISNAPGNEPQQSSAPKELSAMTVEELEAELARRKAASNTAKSA